MNRPLAAALGLVLAGSLAAAVPSYADDPLPIPTITSPTWGETVGESVTLTATAPGAPYLLFELSNTSSSWLTLSKSPVPPGPDGSFADTLPTKGLGADFRATARSCQTANVSSCDSNVDTLGLKRAALPAVTEGAGWREFVDPAATPTVPVVIPDTIGLDVFLSTPKGRLAPGPAGPRNIDISGLSDRRRGVAIAQCSDLDPFVCTSRGVSFVVRNAPHASVRGDRLLSQNWDDLWDVVDYRLTLDNELPVKARWRVLRGTTTVMGPVDYPASVISTARSHGAELRLDPHALLGHQLPAGDYQFQVEVIPDNVPGYTKRARVAFPLRVANAPADWRLNVDRSVIYPRDYTGLPRTVRILNRLDATEVRYGSFSYRVVNGSGRQVAPDGRMWYALSSLANGLTWDGRTYDGDLVPAGRYRVEVRAQDDEQERVGWSPYFTVSNRHRVYQQVMTEPARAAKSLIRKSKLKYGRIVHGPRGSIDYIGRAPGYLRPDLRTLHVLKLPKNRLGGVSIRFAGSWPYYPSDDVYERPSVFLIDRHGRRDEVNVWDHLKGGSMQFPVGRRFVRRDGTVRFEIGTQYNGRTRIRAFRIGYSRYRWVN